MKRSDILRLTFTFWILVIILSGSWLMFLLSNGFDMMYENLIYIAILLVASFSFMLSIFFITNLLFDVRIEIKKAKQKEKNIRDLLRYEQLMEPPSIYN